MKFQCSDCKKTFSSRGNLGRHCDRVHKRIHRYVCIVCNMSFFDKFSLERHERSHDNPRPLFGCQFCQMDFTDPDNCRRHERMFHKDPVSSSNPQPGDDIERMGVMKKKMQRRSCRRFGVQKCSIKMVANCTSTSPLIQDNVHKAELSTSPASQWRRPVTRQMERSVTFPPSLNPVTVEADNEERLNGVEKMKVEKGILPMPSLPRRPRRNFAKSDASSTVNMTPVFQCTDCAKTFSNQGNVDRHRARVHEGARYFRCPQCPASFFDKYCLQRHRRCHDNVKPYVCEYCWAKFSDRANWRRHMKKIHSVDQHNGNNATSVTSPMIRETVEHPAVPIHSSLTIDSINTESSLWPSYQQKLEMDVSEELSIASVGEQLMNGGSCSELLSCQNFQLDDVGLIEEVVTTHSLPSSCNYSTKRSCTQR